MSVVMVVEDEPDIRLLTRIVLEGAGHTVVEAGHGEQAMELMTRHPPDLVLLDIRLPGLDGWDVLERMHANDSLKALPVVVMSAHSSGHALARAREMGSQGYLLKPFTQEELLAVVAANGAG
jgi:two-component system chemotaxis response regulator CheY